MRKGFVPRYVLTDSWLLRQARQRGEVSRQRDDPFPKHAQDGEAKAPARRPWAHLGEIEETRHGVGQALQEVQGEICDDRLLISMENC